MELFISSLICKVIILISTVGQIDLLSEKALEAVNLRGDDLADNCLKALRKKGATFDDEFIESLASGRQQEDPDIEAFRQQVLHGMGSLS
jgi:hypothetical protein